MFKSWVVRERILVKAVVMVMVMVVMAVIIVLVTRK